MHRGIHIDLIRLWHHFTITYHSVATPWIDVILIRLFLLYGHGRPSCVWDQRLWYALELKVLVIGTDVIIGWLGVLVLIEAVLLLGWQLLHAVQLVLLYPIEPLASDGNHARLVASSQLELEWVGLPFAGCCPSALGGHLSALGLYLLILLLLLKLLLGLLEWPLSVFEEKHLLLLGCHDLTFFVWYGTFRVHLSHLLGLNVLLINDDFLSFRGRILT